MPAALPADWSAIRTMNANGATLEELAESTGININTLKARSAREGWQVDTKALQQSKSLVAIAQGKMQPAATNGSDLAAITLKERFAKSKMSIAGYLVKASTEAEEDGRLAIAGDVAHLAGIQAKLDPVKEDQGMRLSLFNVAGDMTVIER